MSSAEVVGSPRWATEPFIVGTPAQFQRLREWLRAVHYTEDAICTAAGVEAIAKLRPLASGRAAFSTVVDAQSLLVQLFLDSALLPWGVVKSTLSPDELTILTDLGLLVSSVSDPNYCIGSVALFPSSDLYLVSDRLTNMETIGDGVPSDLVYSPLTMETFRFIKLMPRTPCDDYLEMCAGTGVAALHAAKGFARYAYSADITERSTRFAQFNAALNGLENFSAVQGDLYDPVSGKTFDLITAHPPYVPAESTEMVFRDGGADGEQITRRIVAGLSEYLRPGGLFYLDCVMTDRTNDSLANRTRRMLGPMEDEFDVLVVRTGEVDTKTYQADRLSSGRMSPEVFARQSALFKDLGIERLVAVTTLIQRRDRERPVFTAQRVISGSTRAEDLLWLMRYLSETVGWGVEATCRLLDARPRALPHVQLRVRSALREGRWNPLDTRVETTAPFSTDSPCPPWFPSFLARCDGRTTVRAVFDQLRGEGEFPREVPDEDLAQMIREIADVPFVEFDAFPLPVSS